MVMGRRVFLSILGIAFYQKCRYTKGGFVGTETPFVQMNLLEYLQQEENWGREGDQVLMFLTEKARLENWDKEIVSRFSPKDKQAVPYVGLEKILQNMGVAYQAVPIPEGKDADEMWQLFEVIFEQLQEDDELYLDITNSFRYLPMLLVVLVNYAKTLKKVKVKAIFYGNYEARNQVSNVAPIMDLLPLSVLQDWTSATSDYLRYGQVEKLHELTETSMAPILRDSNRRTKDDELLRQFVKKLKETVEERTTCRGKKIIKSENLRDLENNANKIQNVVIVQLRPLFEKIRESLSDFDAKENVMNCIKAAKWCNDNKLYQQATTLLEEGLATWLCCHYKLDYNSLDDRNVIFACIHHKIRKKDKADCDEPETVDKVLVSKILSDTSVWGNKNLVTVLQQVVELRNDYNHAGFNKNPFASKKVIERITELLDGLEDILTEI